MVEYAMIALAVIIFAGVIITWRVIARKKVKKPDHFTEYLTLLINYIDNRKP